MHQDRQQRGDPRVDQQRVPAHSGSLLNIARGRWRRIANTSRSRPGTQTVCAPVPSARTVASATSSGVVAIGARSQSRGHSRRHEPGADDQHPDAGPVGRVGQALRERVEPRLGGAVDRVARARPLGGDAREHHERSGALVAQPAQRLEQQRARAGEVDPHHLERLVAVRVEPGLPAEHADRQHDRVEAPGPLERPADHTLVVVEVVGVDDVDLAAVEFRDRSSSDRARWSRSRSRPIRYGLTGPFAPQPADDREPDLRAARRAAARGSRPARRGPVAPVSGAARRDACAPPDPSARAAAGRRGHASVATPRGAGTSRRARRAGSARPSTGRPGRRRRRPARRSGRAAASSPGAARGMSSASVQPAIGNESGASLASPKSLSTAR